MTYDPPDYNYYYKELPNGGRVRLYKVGDQFYYKGGRVRYMENLAVLEADAEAEHEYAGMQAMVVDTKPIQGPVVLPPDCEMIKLSGGPLDGHSYPWRISYPAFMRQFVDVDGRTRSARYQRDMAIVEVDGVKQRVNSKDNIYYFKDILS